MGKPIKSEVKQRSAECGVRGALNPIDELERKFYRRSCFITARSSWEQIFLCSLAWRTRSATKRVGCGESTPYSALRQGAPRSWSQKTLRICFVEGRAVARLALLPS